MYKVKRRFGASRAKSPPHEGGKRSRVVCRLSASKTWNVDQKLFRTAQCILRRQPTLRAARPRYPSSSEGLPQELLAQCPKPVRRRLHQNSIQQSVLFSNPRGLTSTRAQGLVSWFASWQSLRYDPEAAARKDQPGFNSVEIRRTNDRRIESRDDVAVGGGGQRGMREERDQRTLRRLEGSSSKSSCCLESHRGS